MVTIVIASLDLCITDNDYKLYCRIIQMISKIGMSGLVT